MEPPAERRRADLLLAAAALLAAFAFAAALRVPYAAKPATSDEIALVDPRGIREMALDYETRSNPPLHRIVVNLPFRDSHTRWRAGQLLSVVSTAVAIALAFSLGRRMARGSIVAGFAAAMVVAANPTLLEESTRFRSYAPWLAVALWQWHALARLLDDDSPPRSRAAAIEFAVSSALLPWLHYTSVILLAAEALALLALRRMRVAALLIPSAVALLPVAWLYHASKTLDTVPPRGDLLRRLVDLGGGGLTSLREFQFTFFQPVNHFRSLFSVLVPIAIVVALVWSRSALRSSVPRIAAVTYVVMLAGTTWLGEHRLVRPPAALWLLPMIVVCLIALPRGIPFRVVRQGYYALCIAVAVVLGASYEVRPHLGEAVASIVERWPHVRERARGGEVRVLPDYAAHTFLFQQRGLTSRELARVPGCAEGQLCWRDGDMRIVGGGRLQDAPPGALLVIFREPGQSPPVTNCPAVRWHPNAWIAVCPDVEGEPDGAIGEEPGRDATAGAANRGN